MRWQGAISSNYLVTWLVPDEATAALLLALPGLLIARWHGQLVGLMVASAYALFSIVGWAEPENALSFLPPWDWLLNTLILATLTIGTPLLAMALTHRWAQSAAMVLTVTGALALAVFGPAFISPYTHVTELMPEGLFTVATLTAAYIFALAVFALVGPTGDTLQLEANQLPDSDSENHASPARIVFAG